MKRSFFALLLMWMTVHVSSCAREQEAVYGIPSQEIQTLAPIVQLSGEELAEIGRRVWKNECGGAKSGLTSWNKGEAFASLGIGHFIWYPAGKEGPFEESFPQLLAFLMKKPSTPRPPEWLLSSPDCPWLTREAFMADFEGRRLTQLREYLAATVSQQTDFLVRRLQGALPKMIAKPAPEEADRVRAQFHRVLNAPLGAYALVDYVNFKGEGVKPTERYKGEGWGLLQVLQNMQGTEAGLAAVVEFAASAKAILARRVSNAPPQRHEERWLDGWKKRCDTYKIINTKHHE